MKLIAEIAGETLTLDWRREGARVFASLGERRYELEAREPEPGIYLLLVAGRVYECRAETPDTPERAAQVVVNARAYNVTLRDPKRLSHATVAGGQAGARATVVAPMPGKVARVLVEVGAQVAAGDGLVVVEAMKMQNELKSPQAGTVVEIHAVEGATVNAGTPLVIVE